MIFPQLLVFDLDGTLIDSSVDLCRSVNATLQASGRPELPFALIATYIGDGAATLVRRALAASAPDQPPSPAELEQALGFLLNYYREHKLDHTRLYDGVLESLRSIRERHPAVLMAVLTNKPVNPSRDICQALGIAEFFFENFGGDSFATKKPHPEGLLSLIGRANLLRREGGPGAADLCPADVVMIGDSGVDVLTARRCGARSLGCTFGLAPESLAASAPDAVANHPSEWYAALQFHEG